LKEVLLGINFDFFWKGFQAFLPEVQLAHFYFEVFQYRFEKLVLSLS